MTSLCKWLRWQIATLLDRRADTCWLRLSLWALYPESHPFVEIIHERGYIGTTGQYVADGAYCGKCG